MVINNDSNQIDQYDYRSITIVINNDYNQIDN